MLRSLLNADRTKTSLGIDTEIKMSITQSHAVYLRNVLVDIGTKEELEAQYKGDKYVILPYLKTR